jgi:hypothetical protein
MQFKSELEAAEYIARQIQSVPALPDGPYMAFVRPMPKYRSMPVSDLRIWHMQWKICRWDTRDPHFLEAVDVEGGEAGGPPRRVINERCILKYWTLEVGFDLAHVYFFHGNTDAGVLPPGGYPEIYDLLDVSSLTEIGEFSLSSQLFRLLQSTKPNQYGVS